MLALTTMPYKPLYRRFKLPTLDTLEILTAKDYTASFPAHSHETFCISLIETGTFRENDHLATSGSICLTNPGQVHSNASIHKTGYSFKTFYASPDLLATLNDHQPVHFSETIITEPVLYASLQQLAGDSSTDPVLSAPLLADVFRTLVRQYATHRPQTERPNAAHPLAEVKSYISQHLQSKISLDVLARLTRMDKFKFIRFFRKHTGLSPFSYITLQRIEKAKTLLEQGHPIVDTALDTGFYDQSHFTNYFKHYVGVTPTVYQSGCNILQD